MRPFYYLAWGFSVVAACSATDDASRTVGRSELPPSGLSAAGCTDNWLRYEPVEVELAGRLAVVSRFGPPNFGENPETDEKIEVAVLVLSSPISVCADTTSELNDEPLLGLDSVQLVRDDALRQYANQLVVLRGRLSRAVTGRHFFPAVLEVTSVNAERP